MAQASFDEYLNVYGLNNSKNFNQKLNSKFKIT